MIGENRLNNCGEIIINDEENEIFLPHPIDDSNVSLKVNLSLLCKENKIGNEDYADTGEIWNNFIEHEFIYKTEKAKFTYLIYFMLKIKDNQIRLVEVRYNKPKEMKLLIELSGKDLSSITNIPDIFINREKYYTLYNYQDIYIILDVIDYKIINKFYMVPEFYNIQRAINFIDKLNDNYEKIEITKNEINGLDFSLDGELLSYSCLQEFKDIQSTNRFTEDYMFILLGGRFNLQFFME